MQRYLHTTWPPFFEKVRCTVSECNKKLDRRTVILSNNDGFRTWPTKDRVTRRLLQDVPTAQFSGIRIRHFKSLTHKFSSISCDPTASSSLHYIHLRLCVSAMDTNSIMLRFPETRYLQVITYNQLLFIN